MEMEQHIELTSAEISQLWGAYMNASLTSKVLMYFQEKVEDEEIRPVIKDALELMESQQREVKDILVKENKPAPIGYRHQDVNTEAPKLFSDNYMLQYVFQLSSLGLFTFSGSIPVSTREDVYVLFSNGLRNFNTLHQKAMLISLTKGIYMRPPTIPTPKEVDFVKKQSFLTGWFGERRPLMTVEITSLFTNLQRNTLGISTLTGFSQVAQSKDVRDYIVRGVEIAKKHVNVFGKILKDSNVPVPTGSDSMVTDSNKISPFSDRLMLAHVTGMITLGIGYYGISISTNTRRDIAAQYTRLSGEIMLYSEDGANLMIDKEWLEEPPRMVNRDELAKAKN